MNAIEFFNEVARPNIVAAINQDDDYRLTVNAILSIDATYGILFEQLKDLQHPYLKGVAISGKKQVMRDSDLKNHLAKQNETFAAIRDAAYATKHGKLGSAGRIVRSANDISRRKLRTGLLRSSDRLGVSKVFIAINGDDLERARLLLRRIERITEDLLGELKLAL